MKPTGLYRRMIGYLLPYMHWFVLSALASLLIVAFDAVSLWLIATLLHTLFKPEAIALARPEFTLSNINEILKYWTSVLISADSKFDSLKAVCFIMIFTFAAKNVLIYAQGLMVLVLNLRVVRDMRDLLYRHALRLPVTYYDRNRSGKIMSLILNDISMINASMTGTFRFLLVDPIRLIAFLSLLVIISPTLTLLVLLIYPVLGYLIVTIGKAVRRRSKRVLQTFSGLISVLSETINGIRAVKMFNMNEVETAKFEVENQKFVRNSFRSAVMSMVTSPLTETLGIMVTVVLLWYAGKKVLGGGSAFTAEDFLRYIVILVSSYQPLKRLARVNTTLQTGFAAAERVFSLFDRSGEDLRTFAPERLPRFEREIAYANVSFTYPECDEEVLHDISFSIPKGANIALVGSSGGGKSTILDLLPRFYDVNKGAITIDGRDIRECDLVGLRHLLGIVSQDTILFNDTVRNNIAYGRADASRQLVEDAARAANAMEFITHLPQGMDTVIGEKGITLSGGQKQRLAIARALLRNPPVLILDEATSALDTESERLVQNAINNLMENRTALVVAHRLSTILHADCILVVEEGRIVERGTHKELLEKNGRYKYLYDIQFESA
ncbi:MAG: ATP-binding cassette domain-containing protein [Chitinivibrionales bacterium]|nr:ATP-binding cassette domain-containing protein [Chitinivibrionales bacterium]MBD3397404.1 ATP-binding cassette domain-containing protein [Chitinivibrionales bacterium]